MRSLSANMDKTVSAESVWCNYFWNCISLKAWSFQGKAWMKNCYQLQSFSALSTVSAKPPTPPTPWQAVSNTFLEQLNVCRRQVGSKDSSLQILGMCAGGSQCCATPRPTVGSPVPPDEINFQETGNCHIFFSSFFSFSPFGLWHSKATGEIRKSLWIPKEGCRVRKDLKRPSAYISG